MFRPNAVTMTLDQARQFIRVEVAKSGRKWKEWAAEIGVSAVYLSRTVNGEQPPSDRVLRAFGLERDPDFISIRRIK